MNTETWKDVPGFEGRYQVSDRGRVRSIDRHVRAVSKAGKEYLKFVRGVVLNPGFCRGYPIVNLFPMGTVAVHLIVARAFLPNPRGLPQVNHIDGVKANSAVVNLEWITRVDNMLHAVSTGLNSQACKVVTPSGIEYPSIAQAARGERVRASTARKWATV